MLKLEHLGVSTSGYANSLGYKHLQEGGCELSIIKR